MIDWLSFFGGAAAGFAGGFTLKSVITIRQSTRISRTATDSNMGNVTQRDNQVGGSLAGRDVNQRK
jgi:hypothetical protein